MNAPQRWDVFCTVIDNYGDIGVCWRLARQLANEHGLQVRLWVDDLTPLTQLRPGVDAQKHVQHFDGVDVRQWPESFPGIDPSDVADVVIEAFACELPNNYVNTMAGREIKPTWINLEYLSAEAWVDGVHGMASPHQTLPLIKYFFFPGFTEKTGALIREANYDQRRASFDEAAFRARLRLQSKRYNELTISLFGYENSALPGLLDAWAEGDQPITCIVPEGRLMPAVHAWFGHRDGTMQCSQLTVHVIPFLPQDEYDELLWLCDLNFVRGEDSFVRAQWAEKPFVWQIYPQADAAHQPKLSAFIDHYLAGSNRGEDDAVRDFWLAWNNVSTAGLQWPAFGAALPSLEKTASRWAMQLKTLGTLAQCLTRFVGDHESTARTYSIPESIVTQR